MKLSLPGVAATLAALIACACSFVPAPSGPSASTSHTARTLTGSLAGARYVIEVPSDWNGTLLLYSHGGGGPVSDPPAEDTIDATTGGYLLEHGYALAGSSYRSSGWFVEDAAVDDVALLDEFEREVGRPKHVIAWAVSLGSLVTLGLAEREQPRIDGALAMCGVDIDAVPFWNQNVDAAFAFKVLFAADDPDIHITGGGTPPGIAGHVSALLQAARGSPEGRARTALVAALREISTARFANSGPIPLPGGLDPASVESSLRADLVSSALADYFVNHAALEQRAGGNPSSNEGIDYGRLLAASPDFESVKTLYVSAGLSLEADVARLNNAPRLRADGGAAAYVRRYLTLGGTLRVPTMTLNTVGDESTPPELALAYGAKVRAAGHSDQLRQLFVNRFGHCNFVPAEVIVALETLRRRVEGGRWGNDDLSALNARSAEFDARYWVPGRIPVVGGPPTRSYPSFITFGSIGLLRTASGQP